VAQTYSHGVQVWYMGPATYPAAAVIPLSRLTRRSRRRSRAAGAYRTSRVSRVFLRVRAWRVQRHLEHGRARDAPAIKWAHGDGSRLGATRIVQGSRRHGVHVRVRARARAGLRRARPSHLSLMARATSMRNRVVTAPRRGPRCAQVRRNLCNMAEVSAVVVCRGTGSVTLETLCSPQRSERLGAWRISNSSNKLREPSRPKSTAHGRRGAPPGH
jgi:hypothetical protein